MMKGGTRVTRRYDGTLFCVPENKILVTLKCYFEYEKVLWTVKVGHFGGNRGQEGNRFDRDYH